MEKEIVEYFVVFAGQLGALGEEVNGVIKERGFQPIGGITVISAVGYRTAVGYAQAMVKYKKQSENPLILGSQAVDRLRKHDTGEEEIKPIKL